MDDKPNGLNAHDFKCCDTYGGSSFRHWCMLMKHKGIFIGFDNHNWVTFASSDPSATWFRGCQESCTHGDPRPYSKTACLMAICQLPEEARTLALKWVDEAIDIAREKIVAQMQRELKSKALATLRAKKDFKANVTDKWMDAVNKEGGA